MGKMIPYPKKVLLATDGTEDSTRAAHAAVALAGDADAELHVVHVGQSTASVYGAEAAGGRLPGESTGYAERTARKLLDRQPEQIRAAGVSGTHLRTGRPAAEVVAPAEQLGVDLLVVGSGGPRPMRRAVAATVRRSALGRVSDAIVRSAHCPVLVVRGEGPSWEEARPEFEKEEEGTT